MPQPLLATYPHAQSARRNSFHLLAVLAIAASPLLEGIFRERAGQAAEPAPRPNLVVIMADALYHLPTDPAEKNNVAPAHPEELKRLRSLLDTAISAGRTRPKPAQAAQAQAAQAQAAQAPPSQAQAAPSPPTQDRSKPVRPIPSLQGTIVYEAPVEIAGTGDPLPFGRHAVTRLADWNTDGKLDLVVGGGDGRVWRMMSEGAGRFARPEPIEVDGEPLRLGNQSTTACFVDIHGDQLPDLVVAHSDSQLAVLVNEGQLGAPRFKRPTNLKTADGTILRLPDGCGGRIDCGDLDRDGDIDLAAGAFSGPITLLLNSGTAREPRFEPGRPLELHGQPRSYSYNVHPTVFDLNCDGVVDIAYGMNWGTMGLLIADDRGRFATELSPSVVDGNTIDLRRIAGDDATPTFGDLDGDGVLDLVTGGRKDKLFFLRGVPTGRPLERLDALMRTHGQNPGMAMQADEALRREWIGLYQGLYRLCQGFLNTPASRRGIRQWYARHLSEHGRWLRHGRHEPGESPYVPSLAYQAWTLGMLLHEGEPDSRLHREWVADTIGFSGRLRDILLDFGVLIIENGHATSNQLNTLHSYLSLTPRELLTDRSIGAVTEVITIGEYLGPRLDVLNAGGVNIFANESGKRGSSENPFPKDFTPFQNDYFGLVLGHELNHRVDYTRFTAQPKYNRKYWAHMRKVAGPDVKFLQPTGIGVDWNATKSHFAAQKLWDGESANWNKAWGEYWLTGPGKSRVLNVCRNETTYTPPRYGIPFFLETRQEAIASLANQYFSNSEQMFAFALDRFQRGFPGCLDEWLLMADVYSMDQPRTYLYRHDNGQVELTRVEAPLTRDPRGHIESITIRGRVHTLRLDEAGLVEAVESK